MITIRLVGVNMMTTGDKIRNARKLSKTTQKELGNILGVSPQMIAQYESNARKPKIETLRRIAKALNVPLYEIATWDEYSSEDFAEDFSMVSTPDGKIQILPKKAAQKQFDTELLDTVHQLNETQQNKVLIYAHDLTKISEYTKRDTSYLEPRAAHERTDIEVTDEMREYDDDLMDNDDLWNK